MSTSPLEYFCCHPPHPVHTLCDVHSPTPLLCKHACLSGSGQAKTTSIMLHPPPGKHFYYSNSFEAPTTRLGSKIMRCYSAAFFQHSIWATSTQDLSSYKALLYIICHTAMNKSPVSPCRPLSLSPGGVLLLPSSSSSSSPFSSFRMYCRFHHV